MNNSFTAFGESDQPNIVATWLRVVDFLSIPAVLRCHNKSSRFTAYEAFFVSSVQLLEFIKLRFRYWNEIELGVGHVGAFTGFRGLTCDSNASHRFLNFQNFPSGNFAVPSLHFAARSAYSLELTDNIGLYGDGNFLFNIAPSATTDFRLFFHRDSYIA